MSSRPKRHSLPHSHSLSFVPEATIPVFQRRKSSVKVSFQGVLFSPKEDEEFGIPAHQEPSRATVLPDGAAEAILPKSSRGLGIVSADKGSLESPQSLSKLAKAIQDENVESLVDLLDQGEDPHEVDEEGCNTVHYACLTGNIQILKILLEKGCDANLEDYARRTPLHKAISGGKVEVLSLLLENDSIAGIRDKKSGRTPVHYAAVLQKIHCLKVILQKLSDGDPLEKERILSLEDKEGRTALHLASYEGLSDAVQELLAAGADATATDSEGLTPMHLSLLAHRGKRRCGRVLSLLLEGGGKVEVEGGENKERLIHFAARVGCVICLKFLHEKGADMNSKNLSWQTPLHIATFENKSEATMFFISKGADLEAVDKKGCRPLHMAILGECTNIIDILISSGVDTTATDTFGCSYGQYAITRKRIQAFKTLTRAKKISLPEGSGENILHYCSALGSINAVSFLLEQGWDINKRDSKGRTALHRALNHGNEPLATMLINGNADPCALDEADASPLHYAVRWGGSDAILRLLLKRKAKLGCRDRLGRTPLHYAASKFSVMSDLYILLGGGSELNAQDNMGLTPLHLAARLGNESLVRILLDNGAKHDIADLDNFLPIDHAKEKDNKNIIKRLGIHSKNIFDKQTQKVENRTADESTGNTKSNPVVHQGTNSPKCISTHRKSLAW